EVDVHDGVEVRLAAVFHRPLAPHARGVDERVEPSGCGDRTFDERAARVGRADISRQTRDHRCGLDPFESGQVEIDRDDAPAGGRESHDRRGTDATARAAHEDDGRSHAFRSSTTELPPSTTISWPVT